MSDLATLTALLEQQGRALTEFRATNDELQKKWCGQNAALEEKLSKLNAELDRLGDNFKALEKLSTRPAFGAGAPADVLERQAKRLETANAILAENARQSGKTAGKQFTQVEELAAYRADFLSYLVSGRTEKLDGWIAQDFRIAADADGGYLVPPDMTGRIVTKLYETSNMRALAFIQPTSRSELVGLADTADVSAWWAGEDEPDQNSTNTQLGEYQIQVEEARAQPRISLRLLEDVAVDVESWAVAKIADRLARLENVAFFTGDGVKKPRGITTYTMATTADGSRSWGTLQYVATGASGAFKTSDTPAVPGNVLYDVEATLKPAYRANATWVAARATLAAVRKLTDTQGRYLWEPSVQVGRPATLLGYPMAEAEDMPAIAANSFSIAFGDFREGYTIADRLPINVLRDPYTSKGYVKLFTRKRVGGGVVNFDAIKFVKFGTS